MAGAFSQPGIWVSLLLLLNTTDRNQTCRNERISIHSDVQRGSANRQTSFSEQFLETTYLFRAHCQQVSKTHYSPIKHQDLTASKMNVLHYFALQSEALAILLQETHCTDPEKLVLPSYQLPGFSLSRKHGLATFVHERLRYTLLDQAPPTD